ncbi:hypothetical protein HJC23_010660 [Cyclotella cryptica]|uniref:Pseudouridine synthase RsuA/RluA-like domain-containing protein n=1 Tax=Cyclotella cryptica TaxID=29204 RepID=A0ABD3PFS5_9STRA
MIARGNECPTNTFRERASFDAILEKVSEVHNDGERSVTILQRGPNHIVALKPPSVVCHHSGWTGSRSKLKRGEEPEIPMLQRVRDAIHDIEARRVHHGQIPKMRKVNLVHRLDRGASGALLLAFADDDEQRETQKGCTATLIEAMASPDSIKTYVALVRGEGILRGVDLKELGWFEETRAIKDERGEEKNATTWFNFVAGQPETGDNGIDRPRMSLVLARPKQGRWHQIRKHLNGLSHPILGDTTHGASKVNREWKEKRNMPGERICLHLARLQLPPTEAAPEGIDVPCPVYEDMLTLLRNFAPDVLEKSLDVLQKEGILLDSEKTYEIGRYTVTEEWMHAGIEDDGSVEILSQGENFVIANKPPTVVVHHSSWTGSRSNPKRRLKEATPMLQRVRDATGRRVNAVHRLDRGASGCLLFSIADNTETNDGKAMPCQVTKALFDAMQHPDSTKTYLAICDGDGTWNGIDIKAKGWFTIDKPVKDENGNVVENCVTDVCFVAGCTLPPESSDNHDNLEGRNVSIMMARPKTGRWHQVRQHLAGVGHAIIGDSSHGRSRTNRVWKKERKLRKERTCLHLCRIQLPATEYTPIIDVSCPLSSDLVEMLNEMPVLLEETRAILAQEGIQI